MNNDLDRILGALNTADPGPHFESRLRTRLAAHSVAPRRTRFAYAWVAAPAIAAVIVAAIITLHRTAVATPTPQIVTVAPPELTRAAPAAPITHPATHIAHTTAVPAAAAQPVSTDVAFLPSTPPPPLPLSKDERILRRMASPESHTLLAQVEPMREMARREAAEARFAVDHGNDAVSPLVAPMTSDAAPRLETPPDTTPTEIQ